MGVQSLRRSESQPKVTALVSSDIESSVSQTQLNLKLKPKWFLYGCSLRQPVGLVRQIQSLREWKISLKASPKGIVFYSHT
jgi:hypothetical protein